VFKDWRDALIVPVPKKGDLQSCDNWWGIPYRGKFLWRENLANFSPDCLWQNKIWRIA